MSQDFLDRQYLKAVGPVEAIYEYLCLKMFSILNGITISVALMYREKDSMWKQYQAGRLFFYMYI